MRLTKLTLLLLVPLAALAQGPVGGIQAVAPGPNQLGATLIDNGNFNGGTTDWRLAACASYDGAVTHTADGSGSVKLASCGSNTSTLFWFKNNLYPRPNQTGSFVVRFWMLTDGSVSYQTISYSTKGAGGTGYAVNDTGTVTGGNGDATYKVLTVSSGAVLTYSITAHGTGYSLANGVATATGGAQPGVGTGFTINILGLAGGIYANIGETFASGATSGGCMPRVSSGVFLNGGFAGDNILAYPIQRSSDWVQLVFECFYDPILVYSGVQTSVNIATLDESAGNIHIDDVDVEDTWYPVNCLVTYPNSAKGYLWNDKVGTKPQGHGISWPYGTPVIGEIMGGCDMAATSGNTLSSGTLTIKMATAAGCGSGLLATKTFNSGSSPILGPTTLWHFLPSEYGTLTVGNTYFICFSYADPGGTNTFPDTAIVYENATFRNGLLNYPDTDQAIVHNGTRSWWLQSTDRVTGAYTYSNGVSLFTAGGSCNPSQSSAKLCYENDYEGPCSGTVSGTTCSNNVVTPLAPATGTTYTGGPVKLAVHKYMNYTNTNTNPGTFSSCNPTNGSDNCGPWIDAANDYGITTNFGTDLYFGSAVSETPTDAAPTFSPTVTIGTGTISANFLFLEDAIVESQPPATGVYPLPLSLPSSPVTVNLQTAGCAGVNCGVSFSTPACPLPNARDMGYRIYAATGSTSTPPANSSFQWQPIAAATPAQGQLAGTAPIPCGTTVPMNSFINSHEAPATFDQGNQWNFPGPPPWPALSDLNQTTWTTQATQWQSHTGMGMFEIGDEPGAGGVGSAFRMVQTYRAQANGLLSYLFLVNPDDSYKLWRGVLDVMSTDPINALGVVAVGESHNAATPSGSMTCSSYNSTTVANQQGTVVCRPESIDVFAHEIGKYSYGSRPCGVAIGEWNHGNIVGPNYTELRREELKAITGCQDWGIVGAIVGRWVNSGGGSFESSVWFGNTGQFSDEHTWHSQLLAIEPLLLSPITDSSQLGLGNVVTSVTSTTTASTDCGANSIYTNTTNFPRGQIRLVAHKASNGNILILVNNLCYGSPSLTLGINPGAATSVSAGGDSGTPYNLTISGGTFTDTLGPMEQKVYTITPGLPFAPCATCLVADNRSQER